MMTTSLAVDVGGTNIRAARCTPQGEVIARARYPTISEDRRESVLDRILAAIHEVLPAEGADRDGVQALGVSVPGALDPRAGVVWHAANLPGWVNYPLKHKLERRLRLPVAIGNDANLAALAEWKFGAGRGYDDVLYLTISTGIGGGVISDGRLITGAGGLATEFGHVTVAPHGPVCGCGRRGHLEALASGAAIARAARLRLKARPAPPSTIPDHAGGQIDAVTARHVGEAARAGDVLAVSLLAEAGTYLGQAIADFLHIFNPSIVILGGGVANNVGDLLLEPARAAVRQRSISDRYVQDCPIVQAQLADDAGLLGALALALEKHST